jgi:hypothetical protein
MSKVLAEKPAKTTIKAGSRRKADTEKEKVYQLKITLVESDPEIWRRVLVSADTSLGKLHRIVQTAMGWTNTHLHEFIVKGVSYGSADPEMEMDDSEDEDETRLAYVAPRARSVLRYIYDFGDGWEHKITVEKIAEGDERFSGRPVCLAGEWSCPPEDCGGIYGYLGMLEALKDPECEEYEDTLEWLGEGFDPEEFDLKEVNLMLKRIK